ncbi:uncharacterized protein YdgA (DUF945 family) [Halospina denitrificans]|uniref:Uncharacterized protein YdgA (DUF945 family) n=1 Tax=Halospina denitrificans TaxID=332522 RepID=A0A4R7JRG1_9GAMM|nr:DUF945 family protein [Halospina denitrificans]TDT40316.1 uncharacterized protein YdgA (DUF945 family) [Halospina denitrificans]
MKPSMRFLPLAALILLIGVALGAPYGFGVLAESQFKRLVTDLEAREQDEWRLRPVSYERGYLSATARTQLLPPQGDDGEPALAKPVNLVTRFEHGVTGIRAVTRLENDDSGVLNTLFPEQKPKLRLEAGLGGHLDGRLLIPSFSWSPDIDIQALAGTRGTVEQFVMSADYWHGSGSHELAMDWPGFEMDVGDGVLRVENVSLDHQMAPLLESLWQGQSRFRVERMTLDPVLADPVIARSMRIDIDASEEDGYFDAALQIGIDSFETGREDFGRQVFEWTADGLHARSLDSALGAFVALQRTSRSEEGRASRRATQEMKLHESLSSSLQRLSAHGGEMAVPELLLRLPEGVIEGEMVLRYPQRPAPERDQPVSLLRHAEGQGVLIVDRNMVWVLPNTARKVLERLEQRDIVDGSDGRYHLDVRLDNMELRLNDQVLELPRLL